MAAWGKGIKADFSTDTLGNVYAINLVTKQKRLITTSPLGHLDGIESLGNGSFVVSDWMAGKVFRVTERPGMATQVEELLSGIKGAADIGLSLDGRTLFLPEMGDSRVSAWWLESL